MGITKDVAKNELTPAFLTKLSPGIRAVRESFRFIGSKFSIPPKIPPGVPSGVHEKTLKLVVLSKRLKDRLLVAEAEEPFFVLEVRMVRR